MMEANDGLLSGIVEVDETYLGGKKRAKGEASKRDGDDDQPIGRSGSRKFRCPAHWTEAQRLAYYIDKSEGPDACWPWIGGLDASGYGLLAQRPRGKTRVAHRLSYEAEVGPIPEGMNCLHHCDNPPCCNPAHLFLGTQAENVADMVSKERQSKPMLGRRGTAAPGYGRKDDAHPSAVLTWEVADAIRATSGSHREIAQRFGFGKTTVQAVRSGRTWRRDL
jgi:hypothetical protein